MKNKLKLIWSFLNNLFGLIRSIYFMLSKSMIPRVFYGFWHFELSKKYAHKRFRKYPAKYDKLGKAQGVFVHSDESLIVLSPREMKRLKKTKHISNEKSYKKLFNRLNLYKVA